MQTGDLFFLGQFLERHIPEELWKRILATFQMDSYDKMWKALKECMALFREVSAQVSEQLSYPYPSYDKQISDYVARQEKKYFGDGDCKSRD